jgi:hypothetical protein
MGFVLENPCLYAAYGLKGNYNIKKGKGERGRKEGRRVVGR